MAREAPRTLYSLSAAYQRHIRADDYEVIVVDNGSAPAFDPVFFAGLAGNFRLIRIDPAPPSPAFAVNRGLAEARGEIVGVMIDGARMVTPGMLHFAYHGAGLYDRAIVAPLNWELGADFQRHAADAGYDKAEEDRLLDSIEWQKNGYRLFEIATLAGSTVDGWVRPIAETNALFLRREVWNELGGMDERFDIPGGGFVNPDVFRRAVDLPGAELVILLGEGTFHQMHGGISTNSRQDLYFPRLKSWQRQYREIRGYHFDAPRPRSRPTYLGVLQRPELAGFVRALLEPIRGQYHIGLEEPPLGRSFDRELWTSSVPIRPQDPVIAALTDLAQAELRARRFEACAAVARLARRHAPDEPEPQRLLKIAGPWLMGELPPREQYAHFFLALAQAYRLLGDQTASSSHLRKAQELDPSMTIEK
jgi:glycosyltransferase involved in cell wall biosynthesis